MLMAVLVLYSLETFEASDYVLAWRSTGRRPAFLWFLKTLGLCSRP